MRAGLIALALLLLAATPASAQENPIFQSPGIPPAGANDPACKPAAAHPYPVILVHGTFGDMTVSWNSLAPALQSRGFCVWALDYVAVRRSRLSVVDDIVGLAPSSHGTTNPLAGPAGTFGCTACAEQQAGSAFMRKVNEPPPEAPGDRATNVILQDKCPSDPTEHVGIVGDPVAVKRLSRAGARSLARRYRLR